MHTLTVIRPEGTFFKLRNLDSSQLPTLAKLEVNGSAKFDVLAFVEVERNHYKITFANNLGEQQRNTWYVYRPHVYVEEVAYRPYVLNVESGGTVLKTSTQDSSSLPASEKVEIAGNISLGVLEYIPVEGNHYQVKLSGKLGDKDSQTWYVYRPHVSINPGIFTSPVSYTIKSGDSLSTIAADFYNNGDYWCSIYEENYDVIGSNPNALTVGLKVTIPNVEGVVRFPFAA